MNQELLETREAREIEIARLKRAILAFKAYDARRRKLLQETQWELEDVSDKFCALRSKIPKDAQEATYQWEQVRDQRIADLRSTVKGQNKTISRLQKVIRLMENPDALARAEKVLEDYTVVQLKEANEALQKQIDNLRKTNSELIVRIVKLQKQCNNENQSIGEIPAVFSPSV